jgi:hypothetical protein
MVRHRKSGGGKAGKAGGVIGREAARHLRFGRHRGSRRAGLGGTSRKPGLTPREIQSRFGIRRKDQKKFQRFAERKGLRIDVRPVNPASVPHLRHGGAISKPQVIKAKTVNRHDVLLNPKLKGHEGKVGYFRPDKPSQQGNLSDEDWAKLNQRYRDRLYEYKQHQGKMDDLGSQGKIRMDGDVVYGQDTDGKWKPYAGDNDMYDIRTHPGGETLPRPEYDRVVDEMMDNDMGVNHGAHTYWEPSNSDEQRTFDRIDASHRPGGEPLVRFTPGEPPSLVSGIGDSV